MTKPLISLFIIIGTIFISCSSDSEKDTTTKTPTAINIKNITIPFQEYGYSQQPSKLISSQTEFDKFITQIGNGDSWSQKTEVLTKLQDENIDFKTHNLLFYRMTEGSSAIKLVVQHDKMTINNNQINIPIERTIPEIGTADMAYYALAYAVNKNIETITFDGNIQKVIIENKTSDMIVPKNCMAWNDGCNDCGRIGNGDSVACTEIACLVYRPQDFRCTKWE